MPQDDNEIIPALDETDIDREVADDEGLDDDGSEGDDNELSQEDREKVKDGTGF